MSFFRRKSSAGGNGVPGAASVSDNNGNAAGPGMAAIGGSDAQIRLRSDGADKFYGFYDYGNTCYANSILVALFYCKPFRECILQYPNPSPTYRAGAAGETPLFPGSAKRYGVKPDVLKAQLVNNTLIAQTLATYNANSSGNSTNSNNANNANGNAGTGPNQMSPASLSNLNSATAAGGTQSGLSQANSGSAANAPTVPASLPAVVNSLPPPTNARVVASGEQLFLERNKLELDTSHAAEYGMEESLFTCLKDIFTAITASPQQVGACSPKRFIEVLRRENELFRSSMHQDAHEFLNYVLNQVVEHVDAYHREHGGAIEPSSDHHTDAGLANGGDADAMTTKVDPSKWVHSLFEGTLSSETKCLTCENVTSREEIFLDLSIDLENNSSVTACLTNFSASEMLCAKNKFHCDMCHGLQEAEKRMKIKQLPRILALHLKRFKYTDDWQRLAKLFHTVKYPYELRVKNTTEDVADPDRLYELYAVVVHIGSGPYHGHYVAIVKTEGHGWMLFDDENVTPVSDVFVRRFFGDEPGQASAYVLFYATVNSTERREYGAAWSASTATAPTATGFRAPDSATDLDIVREAPEMAGGETNGVQKEHTPPPVPAAEQKPTPPAPPEPSQPRAGQSSPISSRGTTRARTQALPRMPSAAANAAANSSSTGVASASAAATATAPIDTEMKRSMSTITKSRSRTSSLWGKKSASGDGANGNTSDGDAAQQPRGLRRLSSIMRRD